MIVLSDGDANVGAVGHQPMLEAIADQVEAGITLSTIGFGVGNYRDDLMEQLGDRGNGNDYDVDSEAAAEKLFTTDLVAVLEVAAKDVKLQVEFDPALVARCRLLGYENRTIARPPIPLPSGMTSKLVSILAALVAVVALFACSGRCRSPSPPPAVVDPDDAHCTTPRPNAEAKCVQDCGPPVVREGDPPPGWSWLSPAEVEARAQTGCPRCLPAGALIATPTGDVAVSALVAGALVWSTDADGRRIAVPVVRVGSTSSTASHTLVVLELADGRTVAASAGHPTADGRLVGALAAGDALDGARIVAVGRRAHGEQPTFDLLPASPTRAYWADGVLLTSTLR